MKAAESPVEPVTKHCRTCTCDRPRKRRSGLKRDSKDAAWSKLVRERAGMRCQYVDLSIDPRIAPSDPKWRDYRCRAEVGKALAPQGLHAAHCFTRGNPRTRLDPDNGLAMCATHHAAIDASKSLRFAIFRWWLGEEAFEVLAAEAHEKRNRL